ncbi:MULTISPECIES: hypothetical protein [unclassified Micromonospora]|uniref:hypothetical protein n=1 Tax=unclassified Micromonospora TaxID=2617518 RepID=UPI001C22DEC1|nr:MULTISPECIES: hypothetical protein [unclassified Micromonospora]MBU8857749.1 hypothetical protein [Micromonospora sp. WMMB482]MDM4783376.1 hypothetical protein [Micromonospora sp. b486]
MLSANAVRTLTACLEEADADAAHLGWGDTATLLLIHDWPLNPALPRRRKMRSLEFPLHPEDLLAHPAGLPALLHRLAEQLRDPATVTPYQKILQTMLARARATAPDVRLLAWAVCYHDIHLRDGRPALVRRVDAVDIDQRVYQLTHPLDEDRPFVLVDDAADPADTPATRSGLAALLTATVGPIGHRPS